MKSLAPSTLRSYKSAINSYFEFCRSFHITPPFPLAQVVLARFAAYLASKNMSYISIRVYLSGIRFMQIACGLPDPSLSSFCHLEYVLWGIRKLTPMHKRACRLL